MIKYVWLITAAILKNHNLRIISILLISVFMLGCSKKPGDEAKRTIVFGNVKHWQQHPEVKEYTLTMVDFSGNSSGHTGSINNAGTFKIVFEQYVAEDVSIDNFVGTFIAHPGDSIHIDIDLDYKTGFQFSGDGARTNNDINKYTSEYYVDHEKYNIHDRNINDYKSYCENLKADLLNKAEEFSAGAHPNEETRQWIKNYINIRYTTELLKYPFGDKTALPKEYYKMMDLQNMDSSAVLNSGYYELAGWYTRYLYPKVRAVNKNFDRSMLITAMNNFKGNDRFRQLLLGNSLNGGLSEGDVEYYNKNKGLYEPYLQEFVKQPLRYHSRKIQADFKNRHNLSVVTLKKLINTPARSMMDSIRSANKGKVIYIDFWSTWCGPCLGEMAVAKKLEQKLDNKNVVFVNICIDSDPKTWKQTIAKYGITGQQYFANGKQAAALRNTFGIEGVPTHILMDKNGDIVGNGYYLGAGNPLTEKKIRALLYSGSADKDTSVIVPVLK